MIFDAAGALDDMTPAHAAKWSSHAAAVRCIAAAASTRPSVMIREDSNCHPAQSHAFELAANLLQDHFG
jgi:hypothetical protein